MGCRHKRPDRELIRVGAGATGAVVGRGHPGRGAWICPSSECVERAAKAGAFSRALRTKLADRLFADTLLGWLEKPTR